MEYERHRDAAKHWQKWHHALLFPQLLLTTFAGVMSFLTTV